MDVRKCINCQQPEKYLRVNSLCKKCREGQNDQHTSNLFGNPNFIPINTRKSLPAIGQPLNRMLPQQDQRRRSMPQTQSNDGMNSYYEGSIFPSNNLSNNSLLNQGVLGNNSYSQPAIFNNGFDNNQQNLDTQNSTINTNQQPDGTGGDNASALPMDKPLTELCVGDIVTIIKQAVMPMNTQLSQIETKMNEQQAATDNRIMLLENKCQQYENKIETMSQIIVNIQSSINSQDSQTREKHIIVSALPENEMTFDDGPTLNTDPEKLDYIINNVISVDDGCDTSEFTFERVGMERPDKPRLLKVGVLSKENRNKILQKSPSLRSKVEPWKKVFIKKDLHPVYRKENSRILKKMKELKENNPPETEIRIENGALLVNGNIVDRNSFFR